jgi:mono/diheme cytochrome c family protein
MAAGKKKGRKSGARTHGAAKGGPARRATSGRPRAGWAVLAVAAAAALVMALYYGQRGPGADPDDAAQVALGAQVYAAQCASCHGADLQGQADWRRRLPSGKFPAPPHDATGHTWHHPDKFLFQVTKFGTLSVAPPGYETDMIAFADQLSDEELWAVLAYIKSAWPPAIRRRQADTDRRAR